jgi:uncharacterized protein YjbI with pentapeptide repeats
MKYITASLLTLFVLGLMIPSAFAEVPDWVKNTAGWWATDAISETEFVNAIEFLVKENIIQINVSQTSETSQLPDWLVNNAGWWAAKIFTNSNFNFDPGYIKEEIYPCDEGSTSHACIEVTYNSHGFRGNEFEKEKPDNTFRIFTVGGSTTIGDGVEDDETWPAHLQQIINEKITGKKIEVINFGVNSATTEHEYEIIRNRISSLISFVTIEGQQESIAEQIRPSLDPDLIIMYDGWNDALQKDVYLKKLPVERTIQNWESVCKLGKNEGFGTIIIVQPMPITGQRVTTEQEIENSISNLPYLQKSQQYVDAFEELDKVCTKTADFRRIFDYVQEPIFYDGGHTMSFGNKIIAENVFSVISPIYFGQTYSVIHSDLQIGNNEPETGIVYAVGANFSGKNFDNLNLQNAVFDKADLNNTSFKNTIIDGARFVFANLNNSNLLDRTDLSNINLAGTDLSDVSFRGKNLSGTILTGVDLSGKDFTGTTLTGADLSRTILTDVDLSDMDLTDTILRRTNLSGVNLTGTILTGVDLSSAILTDVDLSGVNLTGTILTGVDLSGKDLTGTILRGADLSNSKLADVDLSGKDLTGTILRGADLSNSKLVGVDLSGKDLTGTILRGADLSNSKLVGVDLSAEKSDPFIASICEISLKPRLCKDLTGTILRGADLSNSKLVGVDLSGKDLTGTILRGSNLTNAVLTGAILTEAELENAVLTNAILNCKHHPICLND